MRYPIDDVELAEALGLSYQQIATALGVTRQAVRNAVVKPGAYLTIDRLLQVYDHLPEGTSRQKVAEAIRQRLPWQTESVQPLPWQQALRTDWSTIWLVAPSLASLESACLSVAKAANGREDVAVAILLPKTKEADIHRLIRLFPNVEASPAGQPTIRFAIAEFPHAGLFPALLLLDPSERSVASYLISNDGLIPIPEQQVDAMVLGGLYTIDPWRDNDTWGIRNVYAARQREIVLDLPAAAATEETSDERFSVRFADRTAVHGGVSVSFDDTRAGWWMTVEGDDLHPSVKTVALTGTYEGKDIEVFRLDADALPSRSPWPLPDVLPAELLRERAVRLVMEVV